MIFYLGFVCAIFWGVGTHFEATPWFGSYWYIAHGVSIGDFIFIFTLMLLLFDSAWRMRFEAALAHMKYFATCIFLLSTILLASVVINTPIYGGDFFDAMACLKLIYFILVAVFVHAYVNRYGLLSVLFPFILGLSFIALDQLHHAFTSSDAVLIAGGLPMVRSPNVTGAVFGYGILFCSLAILYGGQKIYLLAASFFVFASVFTFSKGTWLMAFFGVASYFAAMTISKKSNAASRRVFVFLTLVVALIVIYLGYDNYDALKNVFEWKISTTEDNQSVDERFNFALAGLYAMVEHPLLGLGFRNYPVVKILYPDLIPAEVDNAHNVFFQTGAVGGVIAFMLLVWLFIYPFKLLSRILPLKTWAGKIYLGTAFLVMFIFGSVQLQLIAQPVFWVFIGLISGWHYILNGRHNSLL